MPQRKHAQVHLRLTARAFRYPGLIVLTTLCVFGATAMVIAMPELVGFAIDVGFDIGGDGVARGDMGTLAIAATFLILAAVFRGFFTYGQQYLGEKVSQAVAYDFRNDIYDHLQRLSYAYHDNAQIGQIMSRATQDVEGVRFFVSMGLIRLVYILVLVGVSAALMLATNVKVALVGLAFMPIVAVQASIITLQLRPVWLEVQDLQGQMSTVLQENLTGQRVVKAFARERFEEEKFDVVATELFDRSYMTSNIQALNEPIMSSLWILSLALVFWFGGHEIIAGRMTTGDLTTFLLYLTMLQVPVRSIGFMVNIFARAHSAGARIYELLDAESPVREKADAVPIRAEQRPGHLRQRRVRLRGGPSRPPQHRHRGEAGRVDRAPRSHRLRQVDDREPAAALLRRDAGRDPHRWPGRARRYDRLAPLDHRHRAAGPLPLRRDHPRQHRIREARRHRGRRAARRPRRPHPRLHRAAARRLRHLGRRARHRRCPAVSASVSRLRAPCSWTRASSSLTTRPRPWTCARSS